MSEKYISVETAVAEIKADAGCDVCCLKMAGCCLTCSAGRKIRRIEAVPPVDVQPVKEKAELMKLFNIHVKPIAKMVIDENGHSLWSRIEYCLGSFFGEAAKAQVAADKEATP